MTTEVPYDRDVLVETIVYHGRTDIRGCHCGWAKLGASHAEHVADVYEAAVAVAVGRSRPHETDR